jgi:peptidoglycan LD-endopeptidase LytH
VPRWVRESKNSLRTAAGHAYRASVQREVLALANRLSTDRLPAAVGCALLLAVGACAPALVPLQPRPPLLDLPRGGVAPATSAAAPTADEREYFAAQPLMIPVAGVRPGTIRDSFNAPRSGGRTHQAFDIMAPRGTAVIAASNGRIIGLRSNNLGGTTVYLLDDAERFVQYYAHLDAYAAGIREGMRVRQGQLLGYVGSTGNASPSAPHLHFQVLRVDRSRRDWWNGPAVDVREFLAIAGERAGGLAGVGDAAPR